MHPYDVMTEPELKLHFRQLAEIIKAKLPPGTGFIVLAAPFGAGGVAQYVSNVDKDDAGKWMVETLQRWLHRDYVAREGN